MPTGSVASVGSGEQRGLKRAVDAELMLLFRVGLTAGLGGA
jgi:hypothetical protein